MWMFALNVVHMVNVLMVGLVAGVQTFAYVAMIIMNAQVGTHIHVFHHQQANYHL